MEEGKNGSKLFENCHRKDIVKEHVNKLGNLFIVHHSFMKKLILLWITNI